ncbi:Hypothetical protein NTJ_02766 [Nesidiocoris tenuis]|uniref:Cupin-like domain-containing protein n=1 Tax=Nesidiocoris tenuis TaxID=355587 RepID=A0ABN7AF10_9HEMI|nr:Hypothetical protein NTJ_02766 [Nesidiocoris tenuis]
MTPAMNRNVRTSKKPTTAGSEAEDTEIGEKLSRIDSELISFYEFCEQMGFTPKEMEDICSPLHDLMDKKSCKKIFKMALFSVLVVLGLYASCQLTLATVHASALGRIALIKALSLWDWRHLFYESCLVENPFFGDHAITKDDCMTCETVDSIHVLSNLDYEMLVENYLNRDIPLIVVDAMDQWPVMLTDEFYFDNITDLYLSDEKLSDTVPCSMLTNLRTGSSELRAFLKTINNSAVSRWFVHWQNCDIHAVKALRKFYQRPYFLPNTVSPAHFNSVFMSSDYRSTNMKKVDLDYGLIMMFQLRGSTVFQLSPIKPCNESCPILSGDLNQGEILVFKNYVWSFNYHPGLRTDNIAILSETAWDQNVQIK